MTIQTKNTAEQHQHESLLCSVSLPSVISLMQETQEKKLSGWISQFILSVKSQLLVDATNMSVAPEVESQKRGLILHWMLAEKGERSSINRILRGFTVEYIRQTEENLMPCNILDGKNPEAKVYWKSQPKEKFDEACLPGLYHAAASYVEIYKAAQLIVNNVETQPYHLLGKIIKCSAELFNREYPSFDKSAKTNASIYNSTMDLIELAPRSLLMSLKKNQGRELEPSVASRNIHLLLHWSKAQSKL